MTNVLSWIILILYVAACGGVGYFLSSQSIVGLAVGIAVGVISVFAERQLRKTPSKIIFGGIFGLLVGIGVAAILFAVYTQVRGAFAPDFQIPGQWFVPACVLFTVILAYMGLSIGVKKAAQFDLLKLPFFKKEKEGSFEVVPSLQRSIWYR